MASLLLWWILRQMQRKLNGFMAFETMDAVKDMDAVIVAVAHKEFLAFDKEKISRFYNPVHGKKVFMDIKGLFDRKEYLTEDYIYWRL